MFLLQILVVGFVLGFVIRIIIAQMTTPTPTKATVERIMHMIKEDKEAQAQEVLDRQVATREAWWQQVQRLRNYSSSVHAVERRVQIRHDMAICKASMRAALRKGNMPQYYWAEERLRVMQRSLFDYNWPLMLAQNKLARINAKLTLGVEE